MGNILRIDEIEITNIKNTAYGKIRFPNRIDLRKGDTFISKADVLGLYGQNGSGKTAVIKAIEIIQLLFSGEQLPDDLTDLIT